MERTVCVIESILVRLDSSFRARVLRPHTIPASLDYKDGVLSYTGKESQWATSLFLPPCRNETVTLRFYYSSAHSLGQLIIGFAESSASLRRLFSLLPLQLHSHTWEAISRVGATKRRDKCSGNVLFTIRFHCSQCSGGVLTLNPASPITVQFTARTHEMRLLVGEESICVFDTLPNEWLPAVSLFYPGDTLRIERILNEGKPNRTHFQPIPYRGELTEGAVSIATVLLQQLTLHLPQYTDTLV